MPVIKVEGYGVVYFGKPADEAKVRREAETKATNTAAPKRGDES